MSTRLDGTRIHFGAMSIGDFIAAQGLSVTDSTFSLNSGWSIINSQTFSICRTLELGTPTAQNVADCFATLIYDILNSNRIS